MKSAFSKNIVIFIMAAALLVTLSSCTVSSDSRQQATTKGESGVAAAVTITAARVTIGLPTPDLTEQPYIPPTEVIPTEVAGAAMHRSLVNASPEQVGQLALQQATEQNTVRSGTAQILLARYTTWAEIANLGLGPNHPACLEESPLMIVIIRGDFEIRGMLGMSMTAPDTHIYANYLVYIFDLWAGSATIVQYSSDGKGLGKILNDAALPENTPTAVPLITPTPIPGVVAFFPYLHCGDTLPGGAPGTSVHNGNFGTWRYEATTKVPTSIRNEEQQPFATDQIYAKVDADISSATGIESYVDTNKQLLTEIAERTGEVEISLVFKDYVSVDKFRSFAQAHSLMTGVSYLRAIDEDPNPLYAPYYAIHVVGHLDTAAPLPQIDLDKIYTGIKKYVPQLNLKGVYATHAWVDAKELTAIAADPSVYYVDVTANAVRDDLAKAGIAGAEQAVVETPSHLIFIAMFEQPKAK